MSKHTPGPWIWEYSNRLSRVEDGEHVLSGMDLEVSKADADLIAAAPELLEFAYLMREYFKTNPRGYEGMREQLAETIAKAEGSDE